jgi:hypothetical protein
VTACLIVIATLLLALAVRRAAGRGAADPVRRFLCLAEAALREALGDGLALVGAPRLERRLTLAGEWVEAVWLGETRGAFSPLHWLTTCLRAHFYDRAGTEVETAKRRYVPRLEPAGGRVRVALRLPRPEVLRHVARVVIERPPQSVPGAGASAP